MVTNRYTYLAKIEPTTMKSGSNKCISRSIYQALLEICHNGVNVPGNQILSDILKHSHIYIFSLGYHQEVNNGKYLKTST